MINQDQNPVEWPLLIYELEDTVEHLNNLISRMTDRGSIDDEDYKIQISHIYSHLNRAWNSRNRPTDMTDENYDQECKFPDDIEPI